MPSVVAIEPALLVVAAVLGLAVGSFLNVVVHRLPLGMSLSHPGSRCPSCGTPILARHNVPLFGWLVLRGRCHTCRAPISARYPLVEAGTGLAFVAVVVALVQGADRREFAALAPVPAWLWLAASLLAAALIDVDGDRMPVRFALLTPAVVALLVVAAAVPAGAGWSVVRAGIGGAILAAVIGGTALFGPGRAEVAGFGAAAGIALGAVSWPTLAVGGAGCVLTVLATIALRSRRVPAVALLAVATAAGLVAGAAIGY